MLLVEVILFGLVEDGFSLLVEYVLELWLVVCNFVIVLLCDFKLVLVWLDCCLGWLIGGVELDVDYNLISFEYLGVVIYEVFVGCELVLEVYLVLIKLCECDLCVLVGCIYEKLDE